MYVGEAFEGLFVVVNLGEAWWCWELRRCWLSQLTSISRKFSGGP